MKNSQKIYDSNTMSNKINKEQSINYHKKNLNLIKQRRSRINLNEEEMQISQRKKSLGNNFQKGKKNLIKKIVEDFEVSLVNRKIHNRLQTIITSPSRVIFI